MTYILREITCVNAHVKTHGHLTFNRQPKKNSFKTI